MSPEPRYDLPVKRFDKDVPLPAYKTAKAAGFDLSARQDAVIPPKSVAYIPLNVAIGVPAKCWILLAARSSLHKKGLMLANGIAVMDEDFCGDDDEYLAVVYNFTDTEATVEKGERIVQGVLVPALAASIRETERLEAPSRGGFGTTGSK